jgi:16S rRNA (cytidine1402-2'-O)-methyltransferase
MRPAQSGESAPSRRSFILAGHQHEAPPIAPGLYVVATPIGNLRDITLRALETLAAADQIACEDTRVTLKLLDHYGIKKPLVPYHEFSAAAIRPRLLAALAGGTRIALVSDAGTPLISDPGFKLVREAREAGHMVTALPGASSVLVALAGAGLPTDRFFFEGFLSAKQNSRRTRIAELARIPSSLVFFETGPRLAAALGDLAEGLGGREAAVCRELTKLHEEVRRGPLDDLAQHDAEAGEPRGEMVIVVAPPAEMAAPSEDELDAMLRAALARGTVKDAVAEVAAISGVGRKEIYRRALELSENQDD